MIKNVKIQVTPEETAKIQKVVFDNNGSWDNKTKICDWIIITIAGNIAWATTNDLNRYSEIDAKDWLQDAIPSKYDEQEQEIVQEDIQPGTIVKATRKSNSDKFKDYIWQGVYFGYCNGKHLIDANTTHVQLADEVLLIPTLTKKEAKQKISELFNQPKNVTSDKVRNIIDLIKY